MKLLYWFKSNIDRLIGLQKSDRAVEQIKSETGKAVSETKVVLQEAQNLQNKVLDKTTRTYVIAKGIGILREN